MRLVLCCLLFGGLAFATDPPEVTLRRLAEYYAAPRRGDLPWQDRMQMINEVGQHADAQPILILALTTDPNTTVAKAAATQLGRHPSAATNTALRTVLRNREDLARYTVTVRAEAARSLGRTARGLRGGDSDLIELVREMKALAHADRALAPAAVDAIALCGMDKTEVLEALREIAESRLMTYSDLARVRVVEWWRFGDIKSLAVTDSLERMLSPSNSEPLRLVAAHAMIAAEARTPLVDRTLKDLKGEPVTAGPPISAVCLRVAHANAR